MKKVFVLSLLTLNAGIGVNAAAQLQDVDLSGIAGEVQNVWSQVNAAPELKEALSSLSDKLQGAIDSKVVNLVEEYLPIFAKYSNIISIASEKPSLVLDTIKAQIKNRLDNPDIILKFINQHQDQIVKTLKSVAESDVAEKAKKKLKEFIKQLDEAESKQDKINVIKSNLKDLEKEIIPQVKEIIDKHKDLVNAGIKKLEQVNFKELINSISFGIN